MLCINTSTKPKIEFCFGYGKCLYDGNGSVAFSWFSNQHKLARKKTFCMWLTKLFIKFPYW